MTGVKKISSHFFVVLLAVTSIQAVQCQVCSQQMYNMVKICEKTLLTVERFKYSYDQIEGPISIKSKTFTNEDICNDAYPPTKTLPESRKRANQICLGVLEDAEPWEENLHEASDENIGFKGICIRYLHGIDPGKNYPACYNANPTGAVCLYMHGMGTSYSGLGENALVRKDTDDNWGNTFKEMKSVCEPIVFWTDTINRGWWNDALQKEYCGAINTYSPSIVFTHSLGNLIIAGGVARGLPGCDRIINNQTKWFGVQGPVQGSDPAQWMITNNICSSTGTIQGQPGSWQILNKMSKSIMVSRYCNKESQLVDALKSLSTTAINPKAYSDYHESQPSVACPADGTVNGTRCVTLKEISTQYMTGNMCGTTCRSKISKNPLNSANMLSTACNIVPYTFGEDDRTFTDERGFHGNDGMVPFYSCRLTGKTYQEAPTSNFYAVSMNHADGTGFNGETKDPKEQPITWMKNMLDSLNIDKALTRQSYNEQLLTDTTVNNFNTYRHSLMQKYVSDQTIGVYHMGKALPNVQVTGIDKKAEKEFTKKLTKASTNAFDVCKRAEKNCCDQTRSARRRKGIESCNPDDAACQDLSLMKQCKAAREKVSQLLDQAGLSLTLLQLKADIDETLQDRRQPTKPVTKRLRGQPALNPS